jgi:hypothetical protein
MTTLAAVLVRQRSAPLETVEQAMLRQSLYGGDLATNLLELQSVDESQLLYAVSLYLGLPQVEPSDLERSDPALRELLPVATLMDHAILPLRFEGDMLVIAVGDRPSEAVIAELAHRAGRPVSLRAALGVRIRQAIAKSFGVPLDHRTEKLVARLAGVEFPSLPPSANETDPPGSQIPTPRVSIPAPPRATGRPRKRSTGVAPTVRRGGSYTPAMAENDLSRATSPGTIMDVWLDFAAQYFDYTAVFAIQGDLAAGKQARGKGTIGEPFARIGVPLDLPSVLERARKGANWLLSALEPRGLDRTLARDLGREPGPQVLILPITIRNRVVLLMYGDHGSANVELDVIGDVLALRPIVERHLERLVVERKRERSLNPPGATAVAATHHPQTLQQTAVDPSANAAGASASAEAPPTPRRPVDSVMPTRPNWVNEIPTAPATSGPLEPVTPESAAFSFSSDEPREAAESIAHESQDNGGNPSRESDEANVDESWDLIQPVLAVGDGTLPKDLMAFADAAKNTATAPKLELVADSEREPPRPVESEPTALLPTARAESHAAVTPKRPSQSQEMTLPTVVVDYDRDCKELIERWSKGDESAFEQLVALGDAAIGALVRQLPGPVTTPSRAPRGGDPVVKASECGPILRALVGFGPAARPFVIARSSDGDPKVRAWAVRLLGELTGRTSAEAVAQRVVLDRDAEVRRAAHLACQLLYRDPESGQALREALLRTAFSQQAVITQRLAAIDALSDLRDTQAIPKLIELLLDPNPGTAAGAKLALVILARQDFGYDTKSWEGWWQRNSGRERIEWVIDSLEHRQPAIRQAAAEELRAMSRIYVGDFDDDSPEARARVQKKYRDWWATGGRAMSFAPKA